MTKRECKVVGRAGECVGAQVRRTRAFGGDERAARESQRRASAYGRARGNA